MTGDERQRFYNTTSQVYEGMELPCRPQYSKRMLDKGGHHRPNSN